MRSRSLRNSIACLVGAVLFALALAACGQPTVEVSATRSPAEVEASPLPRAAQVSAAPLPTTIRTDVAYGVVSVCSLYEPAQLAALLGNHWDLTAGTPGDAECFWQGTRADDESTIITLSSDDGVTAGSGAASAAAPILEITTPEGPAVSVSGRGMRFAVNVTTNDIDPIRAATSELEAEMRIADDLRQRLS